jgi:hypothetical protein
MRALSLRVKQSGMTLTTHLHLVPRLRMSAAIPPLPIHARKACMGSTSPFHFLSSLKKDILSSHTSRKSITLTAFHTNDWRRNWMKLERNLQMQLISAVPTLG